MDALKRTLGIQNERVSSAPHQPTPSRKQEEHYLTSPSRLYPTLDLAEGVTTEEKGGQEMKQKLLSVWHNMKYGKTIWALEEAKSAPVSNDSPVVLLGRCYNKRNHKTSDIIHAFTLDFQSHLWFTYRREFEEFKGTSINSDCGWGCMIRSGQMLVANALILHVFGRNWRWRPEARVLRTQEVQAEIDHRSIIRLFGDSANTSLSPCSIHHLLSIANETLGRQPGDWFGPVSTAHLFREASIRCQDNNLLSQICIYVAQDGGVYKGDVRAQSKKQARRRAKVVRRTSANMTSPTSGEDFSIVDVPTEYPEGLIPRESVNNAKGRLFSGVIDGVPYFEEANEVVTEVGGDFQMLSDGTEMFSLNQKIYVDGEEWLAEGKTTENDRAGLSENESSKTWEDPKSDWTPVLILVPVRLGTDKLNPIYIPSLKALLSSESCVGVIGGRPRHSLYFVGFQDDNLIHLDPHLAQDNVNVFLHNFSVDSFHCKTPRKMNVHKMDPSCCFGFYCPTEEIFDVWSEMVKELAVPPGTDYPMFSVVEGTSKESVQRLSSPAKLADLEWMSASVTDVELPVSEDFVFL